MLSNTSKRFFSTNSLSKISIGDIKQIGPYTHEAKWIVNMIKYRNNFDMIEYRNNVDKDGHSDSSQMYTTEISNIISKYGFDDWKNKNVHISFDEILKLFYFKGYVRLANVLITTQFDECLIKEFNKTHKLYNYKLEEPVKQLKPFFTKIVELYPELK